MGKRAVRRFRDAFREWLGVRPMPREDSVEPPKREKGDHKKDRNQDRAAEHPNPKHHR
jgi:hypothetical protein